MATQQEYSYVANALVAFAHQWIAKLPAWQQGFIPMDKLPAAAGATAKEAVDALDEFRRNHAPPPTSLAAVADTPSGQWEYPLASRMTVKRRRKRK